MPDYQGIGLGTKLLNIVAEYYTKKGYDFSIVTSARNFIYSLAKNKKWRMIRLSVNKNSGGQNYNNIKNSVRDKCKTASFFYINN